MQLEESIWQHPTKNWKFIKRTWRCCGLVWEILLSNRFPDRKYFEPICPNCNNVSVIPLYYNNEAMEKITISRTFNIGNYESLNIEVIGEGTTLEEARLNGVYKLLILAQAEVNRIIYMRVHNVYSSPHTQIEMELNGVSNELTNLKNSI